MPVQMSDSMANTSLYFFNKYMSVQKVFKKRQTEICPWT